MATGKQIKHYRKKAGWTLETLEEISGVATGSIFALEKRDSQRSKFFYPIAKAFGLTIEQLSDATTDWPIGARQTTNNDNSFGLASNQPLALVQQAQAATTNIAKLDQSLDDLLVHLAQVEPVKRAAIGALLSVLAVHPDDAGTRAALVAMLTPAAFAEAPRKAA